MKTSHRPSATPPVRPRVMDVVDQSVDLLQHHSPAAELSGEANSVQGRKRKRNPENWKVKHVKKKGLRKNAPRKDISSLENCCKRECLKNFPIHHLEKIRSEFEELLYEEQNLYLNGLLRRHESKKSSGHSRQEPARITSSGKRLGRPPRRKAFFPLTITFEIQRKLILKYARRLFVMFLGLDQSDCKFFVKR